MLDRRSMGRDFADSSARPGYNVGPHEGLGDCCGFILTHRNVTNWRVAKHGSPQNKDELLTKAAQLTKRREMEVFSLIEKRFKFAPSTFTSARHAQQKGTREVRPPNNTEENVEKKGAEKNYRRNNHVSPEIRLFFFLLSRAHAKLLFLHMKHEGFFLLQCVR